MEQRQFLELMDSRGSLSKETIPMLQDFVSRFPYCQTGHLLLAKCLHDQQNIHFDQQLKTAAVYAGDRKILYNLIQEQSRKPKQEEASLFKESPLISLEPLVKEKSVVSSGQNIFTEEEKPSPEIKTEADNAFTRALGSEENAFEEFSLTSEIKEAVKPPDKPEPAEEEPSVQEQSFREWYSEEELSGEVTEEKPAALVDPHEVIRKRLSEILGKNDSSDLNLKKDLKKDSTDSKIDYTDTKVGDAEKISKKVVEEAPEINIQQEIIPVDASFDDDTKSEEEEIISSQEGRVNDVIDRIGLEHALEETILHSIEKLPVIHEEKENDEAPVSSTENAAGETHSFFAWLKLKSGDEFGNVEEVHADETLPETPDEFDSQDEENRKASASKEDLINQFIATEPRIVPSKVEFYSPVNQAKKSITEHDDLISETLARIYFNQGNLLKSRSSYERLCLLHPEKSSYFAALIQEIDNLINKQE